jgi:hypothetical protein
LQFPFGIFALFGAVFSPFQNRILGIKWARKRVKIRYICNACYAT